MIFGNVWFNVKFYTQKSKLLNASLKQVVFPHVLVIWFNPHGGDNIADAPSLCISLKLFNTGSINFNQSIKARGNMKPAINLSLSHLCISNNLFQ